MKFSKTLACLFLSSANFRNRYSELHATELRKRIFDGANYMVSKKVLVKLLEKGFAEQLEKSPDMRTWTPAMLAVLDEEPKKILTDITNIKTYVIRKTVQDICAKINVKDEKKFDYLQKVKDGNRILVLDENRLFKYFKDGNRIVVAYFALDGDKYIYHMFNFDLDTAYESRMENEAMAQAEKLFIQLIMFLEYAPFGEIYLKPNQQNGTRNEGKVLNDTPQNLIIVDSAWNKVIVRTEGFTVSGETGFGFLALRACGVGRYDRKFVWISPFEKKGYVRGVNKEKLLENERATV